MPLELRRLKFTRSGGFAGLVTGCHLHMDTLPPAERTQLAQLVDAAKLMTARVASTAPTRSDEYQIDLEIEASGGTSKRQLSETRLTPNQRLLIEFLKKRSTPQPLVTKNQV
jgi:hypothetical protein